MLKIITTACLVSAQSILCNPNSKHPIYIGSSIYNYSRAKCTISNNRIVICKGVSVTGTRVKLNVFLDLLKQTSSVE